jgi:4a-hydroxytetrahydrobiopterin dehydratase
MTEPITARQFHHSSGVGDWRVAAAVAAGGRVVSDQMAPSGWVLADPEGNEACVATWIGTDGRGYP